MGTDDERLVEDYLRRLDRALDDLPRSRRTELVREIRGHIDEARADLPPGDVAGVMTVLDRLGDPDAVAAEARDEHPIAAQRSTRLETAALVLLLACGLLLPVVGWLAGVALAWMSRIWSTRDKLVATLVPPGGLAPGLYMLIGPGYTETCSGGMTADGRTWERCTGGPSELMQAVGVIAFVVLLLAPFVTTAYLARRVKRGSPTARPLAHRAT